MSRLSPQEEITLLRKKARRRLVGAIALVAIAIAVLWNTLGKTPQQVHPEQIAVVPETASNNLAQPAANRDTPPLTIQDTEPHQASAPMQPPIQTQQSITSSQASQSQTQNNSGSRVASSTTPVDPAAVRAAQEKAEREKTEKEAKEKEKRLAAEKVRQEKERAAAQAKEKEKKKEPDPAAILEGRADAGSKATTDKTSNSTAAAATSTSSKKIMIQLAALTDQSKIDSMKQKLNGLGVNASYSKVQTSKGEATRVRVGPFASKAEADTTMAKLSQAGLSGIVLP